MTAISSARPIRGFFPIRLLDRNDTDLAVAMIASALVIFQRPLRFLFDFTREIEVRYQIDLIPGLTVLVTALAFHQFRKRQQAKTLATAAEAEAGQERARSEELERLVAFGRALGNALEIAALRHVLWRYMPLFASEREFWVLTRQGDRWDSFLQHDVASTREGTERIEAEATKAMQHQGPIDAHRDGVDTGEDLCFPMITGETAVGVVGVRNRPELTTSQRQGLAAAVALIAIAMRNMQLLTETRENGLRDSLTGCFNRAHALKTLDQELSRCRRTARPLSVLMFDIDHFKTINDHYGHLTGDTVLAAVGRVLTRLLRSSDLKCRYGGDEFLVVLNDTPELGAAQVAAGLLAEIAKLDVLPGRTSSPGVKIGVSIGLAAASPTEASATELIARADAALYEAKRAGRNRFVTARSEPVSSRG
jgi:diguanylate cyclase (GGDEF)-like protein